MRFLCAILAFALAACGRADARETNRPTLSVEYFQQDSARVIARWSRPCDAKGCADSYRVQWTAGAIARTRTTPALADTLRLARPAIGDSLVATVAVTSLRRGLGGPTRTASAVIRNPDAPPPAVDSLRADTLTFDDRADSIRTTLYWADGRPIETPLLTEGDSVMIVAELFLKPGQVRRPTDTTSWHLGGGTATIRLHPVRGGWQDTAWLVAVDCGCRESGNRDNPPVLDVRSGQYVVRTASGGVRPVTPRAVAE